MFVLSHHPHIHHQAKAERLALHTALALGPMALAAAFLWPARFMLLLALTILAGIGAGLGMGRGKITRAGAGWCLYEALLLALLMPESVSWFIPALMTAAVVFARTLIADRDFLPPVNMPALAVGTSALFSAPGIFALSFGSPTSIWGVTRGNFFFLSGWLPMLASLALTRAAQARYFKWRAFGSFLLSAGLAIVVWTMLSGISLAPGWTLMPLYLAGFAAFALIADPRATPLSARGQTAAGSLAGIVFALFAIRGMFYQGMVFSALAANLITPMLDYVLAGAPARER
ncbi:MAG: RnfABCDGE type electron transport complex subunit D [Candidatus Edwardsbacteria bacterium]|nr:RnfABCDGE type electron transport complex subunit D [Candidatus Edwardsbacteria bacterium]